MRIRPAIRRALAAAALLAVAHAYRTADLFTLEHAPARFDRRAGDFTANVSGLRSRPFKYLARGFRARLNDGAWFDIPVGPPRTPWPFFTIELDANDLRAGANALVVEARAPLRPAQTATARFDYEPGPVPLDLHERWDGARELAADDGVWERVRAGDGWRVRPRPGLAVWDKLLVVCGAFSGGRRVETEVIFRGAVPGRPFGLGVIPLWGGRPDGRPGVQRAGWRYGLAWYDSSHGGVGAEIGVRAGEGERHARHVTRPLALEPGTHWRLATEAAPIAAAGGTRWRVRVKWWRSGTPAPEAWQELVDDPAALPLAAEYGVALLSFWSAVEFGPVRVTRLDGAPAR